jgi:hypothetical protein
MNNRKPKRPSRRRCKCGGRIVYTRDFGRWFSYCDKCSPVSKINLARLKRKEFGR